jgi:hypothetical protein
MNRKDLNPEQCINCKDSYYRGTLTFGDLCLICENEAKKRKENSAGLNIPSKGPVHPLYARE